MISNVDVKDKFYTIKEHYFWVASLFYIGLGFDLQTCKKTWIVKTTLVPRKQEARESSSLK